METKQFVEFVSAVVRSLPRDLDSTTAQRWIENQAALTKNLRDALVPNIGYELYLHPKQMNGGVMGGFNLEKHLEEEKLIDRAFSLDDELVKGWIANPSSYPEEFKNKAVFLWKSKRASGGCRRVAYLYWYDGCVIVSWHWLEDDWSGNGPALLASS